MAFLTVRNLDNETIHRLRVRAAAHGCSVEAEHREILRAALAGDDRLVVRRQAADRLAEFRRRTGGRGSAPATELLAEARAARLRALAGDEDGSGDGA